MTRIPEQLNARQAAATDLLKWYRENRIRYRNRQELNTPKEYGLYRQLVSSAVRYRDKYLFIIGELTGRKHDKLDPEAIICLMIGLIQLDLLSGIQPYAAVNETVNLASFLKKPRLKGFINGNLRSFQRKKSDLNIALGRQPVPVRTSHPKWMVKRWQQQYGPKLAEKICTENNQPPKVNIVLNPAEDSDAIEEDLNQRFGTTRQGGGLALSDPEGLFDSDWAEKGSFLVQDASSQQINALIRQLPKRRVLDACASPGGKLFHLEWQFNDQIEVLVGAEFSASRMPRLLSNRDRLNSRASIIRMDATRPAFFPRFDLVLVDAPCSATGTIRKHPELKWQRSSDDIRRNRDSQLKILNGIKSVVADSGYLLYITCSLEQEENQDVIDRFSRQNQESFTVVPFTEKDCSPAFITQEGFFQCLPQENAMGLFTALLQKRPS